MGSQDETDDAQHLHRRDRLLTAIGEDRVRREHFRVRWTGSREENAITQRGEPTPCQRKRLQEGKAMFQRISVMWADVGTMDIVLTVLSCVTIVALYAAFVM